MATRTALVVDDNPIHRQAILDRFAACACTANFNVETCPSLDELRGRMGAGASPDVLVMDVWFDGTDETGIDAVKELVPRSAPTQVVFVTSHIEYATSVYETRHVWFLTKPVAQEDFDRAMERAVSNLNRLTFKPLVLHHGGELDVVPVHLILFVRAVKRCTEIQLSESVVSANLSLKDITLMLPDRFVQSHKSYLVNLDWVVRFTDTEVELKGGKRVPLSIRRRADFCRALDDYAMEF